MTELDGFVKIHASRIANCKGKRVAYLAKFEGYLSLDCEIREYTIELMQEAFDQNAPLVRWVFQQILTHDIDTEKVLGIVFNDSEIVCHVVKINPIS